MNEKLVHHHIRYKEIHGIDEIIIMGYGEHQRLHKQLRKEGKCKIPIEKLHIISNCAKRRENYGKEAHNADAKLYNKRIKKNRLLFDTPLCKNVRLIEKLLYNPKKGTLYFTSRFDSSKGKLLVVNL